MASDEPPDDRPAAAPAPIERVREVAAAFNEGYRAGYARSESGEGEDLDDSWDRSKASAGLLTAAAPAIRPPKPTDSEGFDGKIAAAAPAPEGLDALSDEEEVLREIADRYATAARVIGLYLDEFCEKSLPYDEMIAEAARRAAKEIAALRARPALSDTKHQAARLLNKLILASMSVRPWQEHDITAEDRITEADLERYESKILALFDARPALSDEVLREMAKDWAGRLQIIGEIDPVIAFARAVLARQQAACNDR